MVKKSFKVGDDVKIAVPFRGFGEYGLRKGSKGEIIRKVKRSEWQSYPAYQVRFKQAGKDLTMAVSELKRVM